MFHKKHKSLSHNEPRYHKHSKSHAKIILPPFPTIIDSKKYHDQEPDIQNAPPVQEKIKIRKLARKGTPKIIVKSTLNLGSFYQSFVNSSPDDYLNIIKEDVKKIEKLKNVKNTIVSLQTKNTKINEVDIQDMKDYT